MPTCRHTDDLKRGQSLGEYATLNTTRILIFQAGFKKQAFHHLWLTPSLQTGYGFIVPYELPPLLYLHFKRNQTFRHPLSFPAPIILALCSEFLFHDNFHSVYPILLPLLAHSNSPLKSRPLPSILLLLFEVRVFMLLLLADEDPEMQRRTVGYQTLIITHYHVFGVLNMILHSCNTMFQVQKQYLGFLKLKSNPAFRIKMEKSISYWTCEKENCI